MSREFYVPSTPFEYPECNSEPDEQVDGVDIDGGTGSGDSSGGGGVIVVSNNEGVTGMDCMPLRPGPFHYLISEQAKSLVALQELQNEVGALLEFRDIVFEAFPNLRHKMAASSSTVSVACSVTTTLSSNQSSNSHMPLPLSSNPSSNIHHQNQHNRRIGEWEPGKIRRRIVPRDTESSASSLPRSRSNSHSGGSKNSATVQDSGFSTETSSKDSASTAIQSSTSSSSTTTTTTTTTATTTTIPIRATSPKPILDEAEDELWNLLDVIHRKGVKLREEVETLQEKLESVAPNEIVIAGDILDTIKQITDNQESNSNSNSNNNNNNNNNCNCNNSNSNIDNCHQVTILKQEKKQLLDRVIELEAETISSRVKAQQLQIELAALTDIKNSLEKRLLNKLNQQDNSNGDHDADADDDDDDDDDDNNIVKQKKSMTIISSTPISSPKHSNRLRNKSAVFTDSPNNKTNKNRFRTRTIEKNILIENGNIVNVQSEFDDIDPVCAAQERRLRLGALDSILISPTRLTNIKNIDSHKIAAILKEHSPLELQRHLITTTVHNQCLQMRLNEIEKSTEKLSDKLDKTREENDDLRFQLEERNIELEGTRARVRVLEKLQQRIPTEHDPDGDGVGVVDISEIDTSRYERSCLEQGSSTESARDHEHLHIHSNNININNNQQQQQQNNQIEVKPSPRRRPPSRIPLLGVTKSTAPKPPSNINTKTDSRESLKSLKSLTTRPPRDSSRDSFTGNKTSFIKTRDSSRESLNKSLPKNNRDNNSRESLNKSSFRSSLNKSSSLSRARDSLESNNNNNNQQQQQQQQNSNHQINLNCWTPPTSTTTITTTNNNNNNNNSNSNSTTSKRPLAPARRSQSLARTSVDTNDTTGKVRPAKLSFWTNWMK